jgi:hypothetical protein
MTKIVGKKKLVVGIFFTLLRLFLEKGNILLQDSFCFGKEIVEKGGVWGQVCYIFILG